ncbi:MAG: hypothetical protein A2167_07200 [Planctomycetes bacterium RBG_13_46_10]|nr:MAG: hypothetical protein A2167_07200 [Planctomycetes bacterium RBG_13_46_10]
MLNSKCVRSAIVVCSLFLFTFSAIAAEKATEPKGDKLLALIPADSMFCIRVNNLDYTLGQIDQFLTGVSPVPLATSVMVRMQLAEILGSPDVNGVNMNGCFALFGMLSQGESVGDDFLSMLIPITDYKKFVGGNPNISPPDANGVSKITGKKDGLFIQAGDFALIKSQRSYNKIITLAKSLTDAKAKGLVNVLDPDEIKKAVNEPVWVYGNVQLASKTFGPMLLARIEEFKKMLESMKAGGQGPMGNPAVIMNMYAEIFKTLMKETKSLSLTIGPKPNVCNINVGISAVPDSNMARMFVSDASSQQENKLLGYLKNGAVVNAGCKMNTPFIRQFNVKRMDLVAAMAGDKITDEDIEEMKKLAVNMLDCLGDSSAFSFSVDTSNKPPFAFRFFIDIKDADKFDKVIDEAVKMMNTGSIADFYKSLGMEIKFELKRDTDNYKGISIDSAKLMMKFADPNVPQGQMLNAMFGNGFDYRWAVADGLWICAVSSDPNSAIRELIDEVKAGGPKQLADEMKAAMTLLPQSDRAEFVGTFNFLQYFGIITAFMPIPIPKMDIPTKSNIAFTGKAGNGKMSLEVALPKEHLMEISSFFQKMHQQQQEMMKAGQTPNAK